MKLKSMNENKKTGKLWIEVLLLLLVLGGLCAFGIWQADLNGWKIVGKETIFSQAFIRSEGNYVINYLNQESIYLSFLSVLFSFLGNKENVVPVINLILQLSGVFFFYLGSVRLFRHAFPLSIAIISALLCGYFCPVIKDNPMHVVWFLSGVALWSSSFCFGSSSKNHIKRFLLGILLGIFCYIDLAGFFLLLTFIVLILLSKEYTEKNKKLSFIYFINILLCVVYGFFGMFYLWNNFVFNQSTIRYWLNDKVQYFVQTSILNQYISLGVILFVVVVFYAVKGSGKIVSAENAEEPVIEKGAFKRPSATEEIKAENIRVEESQAQETNDIPVAKPIKYIENPLPLPKKHVKKEMNYAFEPTPDQMHYDLNNYRLDDDYDLKDN